MNRAEYMEQMDKDLNDAIDAVTEALDGLPASICLAAMKIVEKRIFEDGYEDEPGSKQ